eukprot:CAMPEP_0204608782 /NCGR_PEP_ID=MMETSP0661-20131031/60526_1 /ASSEMBLY_ACC=CAM_ASM_000606 /TAXON_ID=109239 /ORGANISM="Alexandrium margalefi, Strain AMGDE01CS-322" /LENGTH=121 /DNA_ID=CAMNT_0051620355 /DNA_START=190 /DNA_END=555 /DNA_ORIENTATION=-
MAVHVLEDRPVAAPMLPVQSVTIGCIRGLALPAQALGDEHTCKTVGRQTVGVELVVLRHGMNMARLRAGLRDDGVLRLLELLVSPVCNGPPAGDAALVTVRALSRQVAVLALLEELPEVVL